MAKREVRSRALECRLNLNIVGDVGMQRVAHFVSSPRSYSKPLMRKACCESETHSRRAYGKLRQHTPVAAHPYVSGCVGRNIRIRAISQRFPQGIHDRVFSAFDLSRVTFATFFGVPYTTT